MKRSIKKQQQQQNKKEEASMMWEDFVGVALRPRVMLMIMITNVSFHPPTAANPPPQ